MPRKVSPKRVARLQEKYMRQEGATAAEIRKYRPFLTAQIGAESNFTQGVGSPAGARDIAQFMPGTAPSYGVKLGDGKIKDDIRGQIRYMLPLLRQHGIEGALRGYNAGPGAIEASKGYSETNTYVQRILGSAGDFRAPAGGGRTPQQGYKTDPARVTLPGVDNSALRQQALQQYVLERGKPDSLLTLGSSLRGIQDIPSSSFNVGAFNTGTPKQGGGKSAEGLGDEISRFARKLGLPAGSRDRDPAHNAAVGGSSDSDHIEGGGGYKGREGVDIPTTAQAGGWEQYQKVVGHLGIPLNKGGFSQGEITRGGKRFRVQVIFGDAHDHGDHIHVGFRRVR